MTKAATALYRYLIHCGDLTRKCREPLTEVNSLAQRWACMMGAQAIVVSWEGAIISRFDPVAPTC